jgi:FlaA1/EpsC-like NDP-sugar epimerase
MRVRWGFIDDDALKTGRTIHGVEVLGVSDQLEAIIERQRAELNPIDGIIVTQPIYDGYGRGLSENNTIARLLMVAKRQGCWVRYLHLEFELLE